MLNALCVCGTCVSSMDINHVCLQNTKTTRVAQFQKSKVQDLRFQSFWTCKCHNGGVSSQEFAKPSFFFLVQSLHIMRHTRTGGSVARFVPQIAGSYRGSSFSKGGIVLANGPTSGCCSECCPGCCWGVLSRVLRIMFAMVLSRVLSSGAVQGAPDHVCYWAVSGCCWGCCWGCCLGCCPGCSGSCLRLGGVRVLSRVLCKGQGKQSGTRIQCFNFYLGSMLV